MTEGLGELLDDVVERIAKRTADLVLERLERPPRRRRQRSDVELEDEVAALLAERPKTIEELATTLHVRVSRVRRLVKENERFLRAPTPPGRSRRAAYWIARLEGDTERPMAADE